MTEISEQGRGIVIYARSPDARTLLPHPEGDDAPRQLSVARTAAHEATTTVGASVWDLAAQMLLDLGARSARPALRDQVSLGWLRQLGLAAQDTGAEGASAMTG
jgi:hypothetical protein